MRIKILGLLVTATLALTACETPTYRAANNNTSYGYTDAALEDGRHRITFRARDLNTAYDFALFRAAELTKAEGHEWFRIVNSVSNEEDYNEGPTITVGGHGGWGHRSRSGVGVGFGIPLGESHSEAIQTLEIVVGTGDQPEDDAAYNADSVIGKISPRAFPPATE